MLKQMVGLALAAGMIGTAQADYITGFETTDNAGYQVGQTFVGVDGWSLIQGNGDAISIVGTPTAEGTQSAAFGRATGKAAPRVAKSFDPVSGNTVTISVRLAFDRVPGTNTSNLIYFGPSSLVSGTGTPGNAAVQFGFSRDDKGTPSTTDDTDAISYYDNGVKYLVAPVLNEFYQFVATVDLSTKKYDLTITGSNINQTLTGLSFRGASADTISSILLGATTEGTTMRLDNLAVTPEPGTLGLLGLGTVMVLARRR